MIMKSHKYAVMARVKAHGVYSNYFVKHVGITDIKAWVEYTLNPNEALIFYGGTMANRYSQLLTSLKYGSRLTFFTNKIGRACRPNAYLVYSYLTDEGFIYPTKDRADTAYSYLKGFNPKIYPLYGYAW